jgi:hypothetical protein
VDAIIQFRDGVHWVRERMGSPGEGHVTWRGQASPLQFRYEWYFTRYVGAK